MRRITFRYLALIGLLLLGSSWLPAASAETSVANLSDLATGATSSISNESINLAYNGLSYFVANDGNNGVGLWRSDGTAAGTFMLTTAAQNAISPQYLVGYGAYVYIAAHTETDGYSIWQTDGSSNSITKVVSLDPSNYSTGYVKISLMQVVQNTLYFIFSYEGQIEIWKLDQALAPVLVKKAVAFNSAWSASNIDRLVEYNGAIYFVTSTITIITYGATSDLWRTDGKAEGTYKVHSIDTRKYAQVLGPIVAGGKLIFNSFHDGVVTSDGTPTGMVRFENRIDVGEGPMQLTSVNGIGLMTYFGGERLWSTDGTVAGTYPIDVNPNGLDNVSFGPVIGKYLYFTADHANYGRELWRTDGTIAGTTLVHDGIPGVNASNPKNLAAVGNQLYFSAATAQGGVQPWKLTCAGANPTMLGLVGSNTVNADPGLFLATTQGVVFGATTPSLGHEPWLYRESGNTWLKSSTVVGTASEQVGAIPVTIGNDGTLMQQSITVTLTLTDGVEYLSDTSGITPTIQGSMLTWQLNQIPTNCSEQSFVVYVGLPDAEVGEQRPFSVTIGGMVAGDISNDNQSNGLIVVGNPLFLPAVQ